MKTRHAAISYLLLTLALAAGCSDAKTLRYATQDEPQTLDPHAANLAATSRLIYNVYEGLVGRDKSFKLVPWLALSWSQPDKNTWRFKLRPGVRFHDGTPFTADDVVFSVERSLAATSQQKSSVQGVASAHKVDNLTVDLHMKEPNPILPSYLVALRIMSKPWALKNKAIQPQDFRANEDSYAARHANGTGPFMVKDRQADVKTVLVENPHWWNRQSAERGNVTEVIWRPIKSNATRVAALLSGEVDFINDPPPQDIARLKASPTLKILEGAEARVQFLAFDMSRNELLYSNIKGKNPFKDLRVRQAIAHAIDVEAIKAKVLRHQAISTGSIVSTADQGYSPDANKRLPLDRERAKRLLAEAGYPNGFSVTLDCGNNQPPADICVSIPPMLAQIGIKVSANVVNYANYFPKLQKLDTSFYLVNWGTPTLDAIDTLQPLLATYTGGDSGAGDSNYGRYSNPKLDALIAQFKVENEPTKRNALIREALLLVAAELPVIPLHQPVTPWAMKKSVDAVFPPNIIPYFFRFNINEP